MTEGTFDLSSAFEILMEQKLELTLTKNFKRNFF